MLSREADIAVRMTEPVQEALIAPCQRDPVGMFCQVHLAREISDLVPLFADEFRLPLPTWIVMHEDLKGSPRCRATFDALVRGLATYVAGGRQATGARIHT